MKIQAEHSTREKLAEKLLSSVQTMTPGTRMPPERTLAEQFNVCRVTMSRALKELVGAGYLTRQVGRGTFVTAPDQPILPGNGKLNSKGDIILVHLDFFSYDIWENAHHAETLALRENFHLVCMKVRKESDNNALFELAASCENLKGIVIIFGAGLTPAVMKRLDQLNIPVVIVADVPDLGIYRNIYSVTSNHFQSGYLKMDALLSRGHRRIGWLPNEPVSSAGNETLRGMKAAIHNYKVRWRDVATAKGRVESWDNPMHGGYLQALEVLKQHPDVTALVIDTIPGAFGALRALYEMNLKCPDDVSIVTAFTYDNLENYSCPKLTVTSYSSFQSISAAMRIIKSGGKVESRSILIDMELKQGESIKELNSK